MTPEARAKQAWDAALWAKAENSSKTLLPFIAAAIRAAENDALERAASAADNYSNVKPGDICEVMAGDWQDGIATSMRALKHK